MDRIICVVEPHRALAYDVRLGKSTFQYEHSLEELPVFLHTLQAWNCTLHILDLSSTTYFKWERAPGGLTWWERIQWFREKMKQFAQDSPYSLWYANRRQQWLCALKVTKPVLPQWIEEKLQAQSIPLFYHSYPLELVRNIKVHFETVHEKFKCFILQRLDSPSIFSVYYGDVLIFLRLLIPMPQESLAQLVQETIRHVEETFHIHTLEFVCLGDHEQSFSEINSIILDGQFYYGPRLERWMEQRSIFSSTRCESFLDRFVLAQAHPYQLLRVQGKRFFLNTLEPKLRRFAWIHILPLMGGIWIHSYQWRRETKLRNLCENVHRQWKELPWKEQEFLNVEAQLHRNHGQLSKTTAYIQQFEQILADKSLLKKVEFTQNKGRYWFNFENTDKVLQKNLLTAAWRQYMSSKSSIEWKEYAPSPLIGEVEELECGEGGSPFSVGP
ncbi:hypothetical protein [Holospora curviuscula]|uniref:Uncharacterized protein n=1 Tax=Holospora curviuscula TaxID=1082868 RepID=A0A2S5R7G7_9PROT|nr:hypothetical protein [Holospora curviuscula]PPE03254.1 hypothetical protein HCUR_01300 [Holospora curviuscula]